MKTIIKNGTLTPLRVSDEQAAKMVATENYSYVPKHVWKRHQMELEAPSVTPTRAPKFAERLKSLDRQANIGRGWYRTEQG